MLSGCTKTVLANVPEMGLLADQVKPGEVKPQTSETPPDDFFTVMKILLTCVSNNLLMRRPVILESLSCELQTNMRDFHEYVRLYYYIITETARLYALKYSQFHTPVSVHKILIHRPEITVYWTMSQEAQESRNKDV
jgi:hypothetical protein